MHTDVSNTARGFEAQYSGKDCYYYGLCAMYQLKIDFFKFQIVSSKKQYQFTIQTFQPSQ